MKKFKLIPILMVLVLSIGLLTGCGKESVTVDDLLTSYTNTISGDVSYDLNMLLKAEADMSEMGSNGTMEMGINMNSSVKTDQSNAYMNIDASMSMFGMNIPLTAEVYAIKDGNTIKTYTFSEDAWDYSEDTESTIPTAVAAEELKKVNWELASTKDGYTLTGKIDMSNIDMSLADMDVSEMTGDIGEVPVTMEFNKNKEIQKVSFDLNGIKSDEMTIKEAVFEMTNFKTDKVEIKLPEEAKEAENKSDEGLFEEFVDTDESEGFIDTDEGDAKEENNAPKVELAKSFEWKEEYGMATIDGETINIYDMHVKDLNKEKFNGFIGTNQSDEKFEYVRLYKDEFGASLGVYNKEEELKTMDEYEIRSIELSDSSKLNFEYVVDFSDTLNTAIEKLGNPTYYSADWGIFASWETDDYNISLMFDEETLQLENIIVDSYNW